MKAPLADEKGAKPIRLTFKSATQAAQRARLGLSVEQLGALIGVSGQSIRKWEQGKATPRVSQLPSIRAVAKIGKRDVAGRLSQAT